MILDEWSLAWIGNASRQTFGAERGPRSEAFSIKKLGRKPLAFARDAVRRAGSLPPLQNHAEIRLGPLGKLETQLPRIRNPTTQGWKWRDRKTTTLRSHPP